MTKFEVFASRIKKNHTRSRVMTNLFLYNFSFIRVSLLFVLILSSMLMIYLVPHNKILHKLLVFFGVFLAAYCCFYISNKNVTKNVLKADIKYCIRTSKIAAYLNFLMFSFIGIYIVMKSDLLLIIASLFLLLTILFFLVSLFYYILFFILQFLFVFVREWFFTETLLIHDRKEVSIFKIKLSVREKNTYIVFSILEFILIISSIVLCESWIVNLVIDRKQIESSQIIELFLRVSDWLPFSNFMTYLFPILIVIISPVRRKKEKIRESAFKRSIINHKKKRNRKLK
ncbi:hypothetical protein P9176_04475 [Bacillus velezensis]|uniref:hypothetical protein n=1 Tax=Bacillus TaxID=1386 RepID=UPI001177905C|nr:MULTISPECIES: hypothetical protein [Bacillus]MEC3673712.1 hypothetical protein [Bacillus velezensis]TRW37546.1 hypothetical protein FND48_07310 [Bacillus sp. PW192]WES04073.1 hypothetical protein PX690_10850 [Bacillus velezensis]